MVHSVLTGLVQLGLSKVVIFSWGLLTVMNMWNIISDLFFLIIKDNMEYVSKVIKSVSIGMTSVCLG